MNMATPKFGVGASALRKEDLPLLRGEGAYTSDIVKDGELRGVVVRSPHASASFRIVSIQAAQEAPGVHLVLTAKDIEHLGDVPCLMRVTQPDGTEHEVRNAPVLCRDRVRHVGDAVAFVVADTQSLAEDAAELVEIDWDMDEANTSLPLAASGDAVLVWPELGTNIVYEHQTGDPAPVAAAFATAAHVTEITIVNNRLVSNYMETRAAIGQWDRETGSFTLTSGSQGVHGLRHSIARHILRIDPEKLRVITPDVGGGFGTKAFTYREYPLVLEAARRLERPVKWVASRNEHFLADSHGRDSIVRAAAAIDAGGRMTALRIRMDANMGAYLSQYAPLIPTSAAIMVTGVYDIPLLDMRIRAFYTNTTPVDAYRGAGRPEAAYVIERLVEAAARELEIPREEFRRRNFIRPEQFPYRTQGGRLYDVGEFDGHMTAAMALADWSGFDARSAEAKARGRLRGIGMSTYIEACAFAGSEPAKLQLNEDGTITLFIGTQTNGQGHATAYSQFIADKIGIDFDRIVVRQGDTADLARGGGTGGSRSIPLGGVSVASASEGLSEKMKRIAGDELEAAVEDIELVAGEARVVGTDQSLSFERIAKAAKAADDLVAIADVEQDEATYPNGTHIVEVEIDPETGIVEIVNYQAVDDFGVTVNPVLLLGQVHGGIVQGIGQCLNEEAVYSEDGQLLTASFMDYCMPRAADTPFFKFETRNVPSTTNALGIKGAGEAATIGACPAVMNAVVDALYRANGVTGIDMPATPQKVWQVLNGAST
ncbi:xanthine dehydrogenase family protein molybdopterin-binding subunit [Sinorhizobium sp. BG8]|uniref:xanthine dehydrogenase family protein molybdopterin-binding subunit n=1 Tax=Sinorhizobium sp. BG8 TaxID=2613773 RepID=UPI00193DE771|nr:xanthine dehydrogenase family protein molybdopterin-binding subunit [Sinorhizobium sp. BG8]QRM54774.1 xanthine dehydrogenase family protein molybdopterin-binding subunit [Sinorhizobium sp. BG8]